MATPVKSFGVKDRASSLQPSVAKLQQDLSLSSLADMSRDDGYDQVPDMSRFKVCVATRPWVCVRA